MSIQIVFFGTGSGRPMPYRNVSGMALTRDGKTTLFDCGEATQLRMMHSNIRPGNIEDIFISHFHGDHVNGLPGLLGSLGLNQRSTPLSVYAPTGLTKWFRTLHELSILRVDKFTQLVEIKEPGIVYSAPDYDIIAAPLDHRILCYGYAFVEHPRPGRFHPEKAKALGIPPGPLYGQLQKGKSITLQDGRTVLPSEVMDSPRNGLKVVYCTDTRPTPRTVELARNADLLIHEATYPGGMEEEAHKRGHSTAADAAKIALQANAKRLLLTHFSQRFSYTDPFLQSAIPIFPNTEVASDLTEFTVEYND